jgi:hypothetical protein
MPERRASAGGLPHAGDRNDWSIAGLAVEAGQWDLRRWQSELFLQLCGDEHLEDRLRRFPSLRREIAQSLTRLHAPLAVLIRPGEDRYLFADFKARGVVQARLKLQNVPQLHD